MRNAILLLFLFICTNTVCQNRINSYEYWFDGNYSNRQLNGVSPGEMVMLQSSIPTTPVNEGLHVFNIRFRDDSSRYSTTLSQFFYKTGATVSSATTINAYQYWYDNDLSHGSLQNIGPTNPFTLSSGLSTSTLPDGLHLLNIRFRDINNQWSTTVSQFFYKTPSATGSGNNTLTAWQYWFDQQYNQATTISTGAASTLQISTAINTATLTKGLHVFNFRSKDVRNQWSTTISQFVYIQPSASLAQQNRMHKIQYWFDQDIHSATIENLPDQQVVQINEMLNATSLLDGLHILNVGLEDTTGQWSSTVSQFFYKSGRTGITTNVITGYRYWYNQDDASSIVAHPTTRQSQLLLKTSVDMGCLTSGLNILHLQFLDSRGAWSVPLSDSVTVPAYVTAAYRFIGNGNWSDSSNWENNFKPALDLPGCKEIIIDHVVGGICILDIPQYLLKNSKLTVLTGKNLVIPQNLEIK